MLHVCIVSLVPGWSSCTSCHAACTVATTEHPIQTISWPGLHACLCPRLRFPPAAVCLWWGSHMGCRGHTQVRGNSVLVVAAAGCGCIRLHVGATLSWQRCTRTAMCGCCWLHLRGSLSFFAGGVSCAGGPLWYKQRQQGSWLASRRSCWGTLIDGKEEVAALRDVLASPTPPCSAVTLEAPGRRRWISSAFCTHDP